jgi:transcriptional regulator with XRE-family HTH domain
LRTLLRGPQILADHGGTRAGGAIFRSFTLAGPGCRVESQRSKGVEAVDQRDPHAPRCARLLRTQAVQQGWNVTTLVEQIHQHCGHSRLRAQRLARGWTLRALAIKISQAMTGDRNVTPSRACRWELGQDSPSLAYREALCRVYGTDLDGLGLARAGGSKPGLDARHGGEASLLEPTFSPRAAKSSIVQAAAGLRQEMDDTLTGSILSECTVEHKEKVAEQYGRVYKCQSAQFFLANILTDFSEVRRLADRRLPSGQRHDLCGVIARLAGLVSMTMRVIQAGLVCLAGRVGVG